MALKARITSDVFAKLEAAIQGHYTEQDGEYFLDVTPVKTGDSVIELTDTGALKKTLQKERKRADDAEKSAKRFEGIEDPEKAREALAKLEEIGQWDPDKKLTEARKQLESTYQSKYEADVKKLQAGHTKDLEALQKKYGMTRQQLERVMLEESALKAITSQKGLPKPLLPIVRQNIRLVEGEDGKFGVEVVDENGNARSSSKAGNYNAPMTIEEFVGELKSDEQFARLFEGSGASGTGGSNNHSQGRSSGSKLIISNADAQDPARYRAYREQAMKNGQALEIAGE